MPPNSPRQSDDLQANTNLQRIDDLEIFRSGFEGKEFDNKVCGAIKDSVPLQTEIKGLIWGVIKEKLFWVIGTVTVLLFTSFLTSIVTNLSNKIVK